MKIMKLFIFSMILFLFCACSNTDVRKIAIPDIPGYLTLKGDFHLHTEFSDGKVWPTVRVDEAVEEGLDIIAITDHIEYRKLLKLIPRDHNRSYQIARPYALKKHILLVKGAEINQRIPPGHFNALFITDAAALDKTDFKKAVEEAKRQGGFIVWNHPGLRSSDPVISKWFAIHTWLYDHKLLNGIEIYNHKKYYKTAFGWALDKNLTIFSNTDNHYRTRKDYDLEQSHRPVTLVFAKERSLEAVKEALTEGRTASFVGETVRGREEWLHPLFLVCVKLSMKKDSLKLENQSDLNFDIELNSSKGTTSILLKKRRITSLEKGSGMRLKVKNFEISPGRYLEMNCE
jgi:hypothetical protein